MSASIRFKVRFPLHPTSTTGRWLQFGVRFRHHQVRPCATHVWPAACDGAGWPLRWHCRRS